jgi:hypothetical protein
MPEVLMINPRRRKARKTVKAKRRSRRRNPIAAKSLTTVARRANPARRRNPIGRAVRRRRNPIGSSYMGSVNAMLMDVAVQTAGAIGVDLIFGQIKSKLPASLQPKAGSTVDSYDALKMVTTLIAGILLSKPTKGYSRKMAVGSLTTQLNDVAQNALLKSAPSVQLGYASPNRVSRSVTRVQPGMAGQYLTQNSSLNGRRVGSNSSLNGTPLPINAVQNQYAGYNVR